MSAEAEVEEYIGVSDWGACFNLRCVCGAVIAAAIHAEEACYSCGRKWRIDFDVRLTFDPTQQE